MPDALVFEAPWRIGLTEPRAPRALGPMDVAVEIRATGICGTDIGIVTGAYHARPNVILGHESAGVVVAVGTEVRSVAPGARVAIDPTYACGACRMCRTGRPNHCEMKSEREAGVSCDGTFAPFFQTDARFVYPVSDALPFEAAALAEPLSCALTGLNQVRIRPDFDVAVVGGGPMGMIYAHALAARGVKGQIFEASETRRALCEAAAPDGWGVSPPRRATPGELDLVVDCSGHGVPWAIQSLRRGGQVLVVGLSSGDALVKPAQLADHSLSIIGSIDSIDTFALAVSMLETGLIPARRLVTHRLPIMEYRRGFAMLGVDLSTQRRAPEEIAALKVVLTI